MEKIIIASPEAPKALGPYSQAVRAGNFLFLSGQTPINAVNGELVTESFDAQVRQVFKNLGAVLKSAGLDFSHVVKTMVFLKNMNDFLEMNRIYAEYFPTNPPARSTIEVARLPKDAAIEIEMIAFIG